ncbi:calcium-binding protein [Streptomyces shenzhenensis]|uniref:calcium-binding protein n=1 Tax=Streptomyces shenzhenensis TaxID=943815 RepID=UPI0033C9E8F5
MRIYPAAVAACGVVALSALAVPAAHADDRFGDTDITSVVVNSGNPVVLGTTERTVTVEVTATDPAGLTEVDATLYRGSYSNPDASVSSTAACGPTPDATTTCTLTFDLKPGTTPADSSLAGTWHVSAYAISADIDAVFLSNAADFSVQRDTQVSVNAPERVKWGKNLTVTGGVQNADWATGSYAAAAAGQPVKLQFRAKGCATYTTVKTVNTAADGTVSATVRALVDGDYRWSYAGTAGTAAAVSKGDFVDVR